MSWTKQKWRERDSNSVLDTQTWKYQCLAKGALFTQYEWLLTSPSASSLQQSVVLVPKNPILYSLKKKKKQQTKNQTQKVLINTKFSGSHPQPHPSLQGQVLGLSLWRIQSLPGNRTLWRTISAMMHPTDQMSTTKYQVIKKQPEPRISFLNHLPDMGSPSKYSLGRTSVNSWHHIWMSIF